ncbi:hypothetical protein [Mycolicibacterium sp. A43C]
MNLEDLAERVGPGLATLVHPGGGSADQPPFPLSLATFQPAVLPDGMTPEQAEEYGLPTPALPKMFLEALFHLLEAEHGVSLVGTGELADLRAAAAAQEHRRNERIALHCHCGAKLARLAVQGFDTGNPQVNGPQLIKAMAAKNPDCRTGHKAEQ